MADNGFHGRYSAQGEIARGGMGVVFRVRDRNLDRTLAMKRMLAPLDEAGGEAEVARYARFLEEAQVTAQLDHPSIVPIHELGTDEEGRTYYTMRLVKGREFGEVIREVHAKAASSPHPSPPSDGGEGVRRTGEEASGRASATVTHWNLQRALGVLVRVCQAVAYAHGRGVIHRDLKPANIMVGDLGEVYVMDWGLAKMSGREDVHDIRLRLADEGVSDLETIAAARPAHGQGGPSLMTMDGAVIGTPAYMPPEQAAGRVTEVDHRSDIYALGSILYELLVGHPPYLPLGKKSSPREVLTEVTLRPPERVRALNASADVELAAICEKAMARDAARRYQSCVDLAEDLQAYLDQRVVKAHRTGAWVEARKWIQRNRATALAGAAALAIGVGAFTVIQILQKHSNTQLTKAFKEQKAAAERESLAKQDALRTLAESYAQQGYRAARDGNPAQAALWFVHAAQITTNSAEAQESHRIRAATWNRLAVVPWQAVSLPAINAVRMQFDLSQHRLVLHDASGGSFLVDIREGRPMRFGGAKDKLDAVALHPAGELVAVSTGAGVVRLHKLADETVVREWDLGPTTGTVRSLAFSQDGRLLCIGAQEVRVLDLEKNALWPGTVPHPKTPTLVMFSPDQQFILTTSPMRRQEHSELRVFAAAPMAEQAEAVEPLFAPVTNHVNWSPVFVPNSTLFYHSDERPKVVLRDALTGDVAGVIPTPWVQQLGPGPRLIHRNFGGGLERAPLAMPVPQAAPGTGRFSPDGEWAAVGMIPVQLMPLGQDRAPLPLGVLFFGAQDCAFSGDGRVFATYEGNGFLRLWRLPDPRGLRRFTVDTAGLHDVAFHPREPLAVRAGWTRMERGGPGLETSQPSAARLTPFRLDTGEAAGPELDTGGHLLQAAFSPDGGTLATVSAPGLTRRAGELRDADGRSGNLQFWDWRAGQRTLGLIPMPSEPRAIAFHPGGEWLAVLCLGGEVVRVESADGRSSLLFSTGIESSSEAAWLRCGLRFLDQGALLVALMRKFQTWDVAAGRMLAESAPIPGGVVDWDVTGDIAVAAEKTTFSLVNLRTGKPVSSRQSHPPELMAIHFSGDGQYCLSASHAGARLWDWRAGRQTGADMNAEDSREARLIPGTPWALTVSAPKGKTQMEFWRAVTGRPVAPPLGIPWFAWRLQLSPDARHALVYGNDHITIVDLARELAPPDPALSNDDLQLLAEINTGIRIETGSVVNLNRKEWMERWERFRAKHPRFHDPAKLWRGGPNQAGN